MKFLRVYFYKFLTCCRQNFPKFFNAVSPEKSGTVSITKSVIFYFYGLLLGALFWKYVLLNIGIPFEFGFYLGLSTLLFLGYGCAFSIQVRCLCSLCLMGFMGKAGRSLMKSLVLSYILTGPIHNIGLNAREVVRVFTCSSVLTYNLTKVRFDLVTKPFQNALVSSRDHLQQVKSEFRTVVDIIEPVRQEIEGADGSGLFSQQKRETGDLSSAHIYQQNYILKLEKRCKLQLERGVQKCKQSFKKFYDQCNEKLPIVVNTLLCWPLKIDFVCNSNDLFGNEDNICSSEHVIDSGFGRDYAELKNAEQALVGDLDNVQLQYEFVDSELHSGYLTAKQSSEEVIKQFESKKKSFDLIVFTLEKMFAFIFIKVIFGAVSYHQGYLRKMEFENFYINDYFRHIDNRRSKSGKFKLLPLRRAEKPYLVDLEKGVCTKLEIRKIIAYFTSLILQVMSATIFILMDRLFYETLVIVANHSRVEFMQEGYHDINITVAGTGVIASLVRRSVEGLSGYEKLKIMTTNEECLPRPTMLHPWTLWKIYLMLIGIAILIFNEAYINRMRRLICACFYPKREKQRILYLYNRTLKHRKEVAKILKERVQEHIRSEKYQPKLDFLDRLVFFHPRWCGWIKKLAKKSCSICKTKNSQHFTECSGCKCFLTYCDECWRDLEETCFACKKDTHDEHDCDLDF